MAAKAIKDLEIKSGITAKELVKQLEDGCGFTGEKLGRAAAIIRDMLADKACYKFLSFPSALMAAGTRGVLKQLVKERMCDCIITTAGTITMDMIRPTAGFTAGSFEMDDTELHRKKVYRLGNILIKEDSYGPLLEKKLFPILEAIYKDGKRELSTAELCKEIGLRSGEDSLLYWAAKNDIPVIVPGITDGAVGTHLLMFMERHRDFKINVFKDEKFLSDVMFDHKKTGALMIGGGISKHHVIWWNQFKDGLDYAVYITTAQEYDGSLSGARMKEAISWGKLNEKAKHVTVDGDATVLLPLIIAALL